MHWVFGSLALLASWLEGLLRPVLGSVLPHDLFVFIYSSSRSLYLTALGAARFEPVNAAHHETEALGLKFRNDLGNAAGLDKDGSLLEFNYRVGAGYAVVGTVLDRPHTGTLFHMLGFFRLTAWTPLPHSGAALNSLGLPSKGVDAAVANIRIFRERHGIAVGDRQAAFPIGVSVMGHPATADVDKKLQGVLDCVRKSIPVADFIEINESCPNVSHGTSTADLERRLRAVIAVRDDMASARKCGRRVPILVKMGDLHNAAETVRFMAKLGVDGVVALNTQKDYASFDSALPPADKALLATYTTKFGGGLSGPPILARSVEQARAAATAAAKLDHEFTVIHVGGIQTADDVKKSRNTGAQLRQWYTGLMHNVATKAPADVYGVTAHYHKH